MEYITTILIIILIIFGCWWLGGIHLDYVKANYQTKLAEYDFENCVYDGYKRGLVNHFGGGIYVTCNQDGIYYMLSFGRRINTPELQMYGPIQMTSFPNQFNINK